MSVRVLVLAVVLLVATPTLAGARGGEDVRAIRALLHRQNDLVKQGKWRAMYATLTPRYRARCPYRKYVRVSQRLRRTLGPTARVDRIQVRFPSARRAVVSYRILKNGRPFVVVRFRDGDLYTKIRTRWYDEFDRVSDC